MATTNDVQGKGRAINGPTRSQGIPANGSCHRCGGLMVDEFCMDLLNSTGELDVKTLRCVQCGELVDPVILANRAVRQATGPALARKLKSSGLHCGLMRQSPAGTVVFRGRPSSAQRQGS